jgi:hypothetical protein
MQMTRQPWVDRVLDEVVLEPRISVDAGQVFGDHKIDLPAAN